MLSLLLRPNLGEGMCKVELLELLILCEAGGWREAETRDGDILGTINPAWGYWLGFLSHVNQFLPSFLCNYIGFTFRFLQSEGSADQWQLQQSEGNHVQNNIEKNLEAVSRLTTQQEGMPGD